MITTMNERSTKHPSSNVVFNAGATHLLYFGCCIPKMCSCDLFCETGVSAYLVIVRAAIHGRLLVELVSRPRVLPHYSIEVYHTAHVHTLVLHHPCSCLHGVVRRVSLKKERQDDGI